MIFDSKWEGSTDPEIKSGVGIFKVGDYEREIKLESFEDFWFIDTALTLAYGEGRDKGRGTLIYDIKTFLDDQ